MDTISKIRVHMPVVTADGRQVGFVTRLQGTDGLRLTTVKAGHGFDHVIPLAWVSDVDRYVFLDKGSGYVAANWETGPKGRARESA
jgi:hypothetical protein